MHRHALLLAKLAAQPALLTPLLMPWQRVYTSKLHHTKSQLIRSAFITHQRHLTTYAAAMSPNGLKDNSKPVVRGVVFDMDGTLTVPVIDFQEMRRRVNILEGDILAIIDEWPAEKKAEALRILKDFELQALADMQIMPGVVELCRMLDEAGIPRGLITRNVKSSVDHFHSNHFPLPPFNPALSRECHMYKPSPAPLLHCCDEWGIAPEGVVIVGDSAKDDVVCGNRAGALTILLDSSGLFAEGDLDGEQTPTVMVRTMEEVHTTLQQDFVLQGNGNKQTHNDAVAEARG